MGMDQVKIQEMYLQLIANCFVNLVCLSKLYLPHNSMKLLMGLYLLNSLFPWDKAHQRVAGGGDQFNWQAIRSKEEEKSLVFAATQSAGLNISAVQSTNECAAL